VRTGRRDFRRCLLGLELRRAGLGGGRLRVLARPAALARRRRGLGHGAFAGGFRRRLALLGSWAHRLSVPTTWGSTCSLRKIVLYLTVDLLPELGAQPSFADVSPRAACGPMTA